MFVIENQTDQTVRTTILVNDEKLGPGLTVTNDKELKPGENIRTPDQIQYEVDNCIETHLLDVGSAVLVPHEPCAPNEIKLTDDTAPEICVGEVTLRFETVH